MTELQFDFLLVWLVLIGLCMICQNKKQGAVWLIVMVALAGIEMFLDLFWPQGVN